MTNNKKEKLLNILISPKYLKKHKIKQERGYKKQSSDVLINKLKVFFKKYPFIFNFCFYAFGASLVGKSPKKFLKKIKKDKIILNLGSGIRRIRNDVINIDFYPYDSVDLIADITRLPIKDNSADVVICEFVLEHVKNPKAVIDEVHRVLKPGGLVYIVVPFVLCFHSSPDDYYRWSKNGFRKLMKKFKEEEVEVYSGPTSALLSVLTNWLALVFSFGLVKLQQILLIGLMIITSPLKLLDYLLYKLPGAHTCALGFYYIGKK